MPKKVYRSLFDAEDVYEVEELTDNPDISESGVARVKTEDASVKKDEGGPTLEGCWDAINKLSEKFDAAFGNDPVTDMEVEPLKDAEEDEKETSKDVKDAYSSFTRVGEKKVMDAATATQVAFQSRYDKVANKG